MIVRLTGALGNQMFQYAFGRAASLRLNAPLSLDIHGYTHQSSIDTPRNFVLDVFNIQADIAPESKIRRFHTPLYEYAYKIKRKIKPEGPAEKPNGYYRGFWQNESYFGDYKDTIKKDFTLKKPLSKGAHYIENIINSRGISVSLHIRHGDYVTNPRANAHHGVLPIEYYQQALALIKEKVGFYTLFVFSDDITWAKENLPADSVFVSNPQTISDSEELILMSKTTHHIIANSSYSWWGAWLGEQKGSIIIAPKQWLANGTSNIVLERWIQL